MNRRLSFSLLLVVAFLDYMGVGLIFPIMPAMLFAPDCPLLPEAATNLSRGLWLGALVALTPLFQFLASPILGSLSDQRGRKQILLAGLVLGFIGYLIGIWGIQVNSMALLVVYRCLFGISSATMTVVQATIVDISTKETKAKRFATYHMALGMGFTLGPFLGGVLCDPTVVSWFNFGTPFVFGAILTGLNLVLIHQFFHETRHVESSGSIETLRGVREAKAAFSHPTLRFAFFSFFLFLFGWDYFSEFVSVTLIKVFSFTTAKVGFFHAYMGLCYALSNLLIVGPLTRRYTSRQLLSVALALGGVSTILFRFVNDASLFWVCSPALLVIISLFYPVASTYLSDSVSDDKQGEILGIWHSVQAVSLIVSPMFSGSLVGNYPWMPINLGAALMGCGGLVYFLSRRKLAKRLDESL